MVNQPPKLSIVSTRQSTSASMRVQSRGTKSTLTKLAKDTLKLPLTSSASASSNLGQPKFIRPKPVAAVKQTVSDSSGSKCQYCGKFFAKIHGMNTHLLEKCEKIPTSARRQLNCQQQPNAASSEESNSKQVSSRKTKLFGQEIDPISNYCRFFANINGSSGMQEEDVANGLKNLRAELRKRKSVYTGITRTPSKAITCHLCKKSFFDCVEYADHISNHPDIS